MKQWMLLLLLTLSFGAQAESFFTNIDNAQLKALAAEGVPIYDVRRAEEWRQTGVVTGSHKLTFVDANGKLNPDFFPRFAAEVPRDAPVILICRTGNRTEALARFLVGKLGYTQVYNVRDGITRWISENNPVIRD